MELLAQKVVTSSSQGVVTVYHWRNIAIAAGGGLLILLIVAVVAIAVVSNVRQTSDNAQ